MMIAKQQDSQDYFLWAQRSGQWQYRCGLESYSQKPKSQILLTTSLQLGVSLTYSLLFHPFYFFLGGIKKNIP